MCFERTIQRCKHERERRAYGRARVDARRYQSNGISNACYMQATLWCSIMALGCALVISLAPGVAPKAVAPVALTYALISPSGHQRRDLPGARRVCLVASRAHRLAVSCDRDVPRGDAAAAASARSRRRRDAPPRTIRVAPAATPGLPQVLRGDDERGLSDDESDGDVARAHRRVHALRARRRRAGRGRARGRGRREGRRAVAGGGPRRV